MIARQPAEGHVLLVILFDEVHICGCDPGAALREVDLLSWDVD